MLHPVGNLAPSIYWRRRVLLLAALALAIVSTYAVLRGGGQHNDAATPPSTSSALSSAAASSTAASSSAASQTRSSTGAPKACTAGQLTIAAASDAKTYRVGAKPKVALVVTNNGPLPCVADLADKQIELRVFAGSARVWGSHDCAVAPGTSPATLPVDRPIRRDIEWSGLSSSVGCTGRQRVPPGTYTLFALLSGRQGAPATFSFTG